MQDPATIPQVAGELRSLIYLLGGGMSLLILKEVFSFIKTSRKNGSGNSKIPAINDKILGHIQTTSTEHALQKECDNRLEVIANASLASLIQITARLVAQGDAERNRRSSDKI